MPKIRNISDDERVLRDGRSIAVDAVFDVPDDEVAGYECQPRLWRVEGRRAATKGEE